MFEILQGDALAVLRTLPDESVNCCVTSPPYWGLRDYGVAGQIGLEKTPEEYVAAMVAVFAEVRRVLRADGTAWVNLGDSYAMDTKGSSGKGEKQVTNAGTMLDDRRWQVPLGLKRKDLVGIPWRVAFALQADGWYLRSDIIWHKPNPMPESVTDRPTKAHEYIFLLSKSERYRYDGPAIAEPAGDWGERDRTNAKHNTDGMRANGQPPHRGLKGVAKQDELGKRTYSGFNARWDAAEAAGPKLTRNKRTVWTVSTCPTPEAHFATYPPDLIEPCILAGCPEGGTVLDPFSGAGTTGLACLKHGRQFLGIELNPEYIGIAMQRASKYYPLLVGATA